MKKTLLLGYGNLDRQDDGVAWHVMLRLMRQYGFPVPANDGDGIFQLETNPSFLFIPQLTPETSEEIARYERVCFIDAHISDEPDGIQATKITPLFQNSAFTHHMTPQSCLALSNSLYQGVPDAILFSIKGYSFGFSQSLSPETQALVPEAAVEISRWADQA